MKDTWIAPQTLFDGQQVLTDQAIRIIDNRVSEIAPAPKGAISVDGCLSPGFIDLQVNGGGGVMVNSTPTRKGMAAIAAAHRQFGTVGILPTVITDAPDVLDQAATAAIEARNDPGVLGLHIEGPHISVARRGTHDARFIRDLDDRTIGVVENLRRHDVSVMITVAPEAATPEQIAKLVAFGAVVSIGHTDADAKTVEQTIRAGASCATHLFNAMSPMIGRAPGAVGAIINSHLSAGIICDGHHVDDRMIALACRARPAPDLMFLVSDSMATVGGPDEFDLYGHEIHLENGRLINAEGSLAGAHVTQAQGVARLVSKVGLTLQEALRMAITTPARVVQQPHRAQLVGRDIRDLVVLSDGGSETIAFADAVALAITQDAAE
ncbi:N-acetylglucosamine-6-phosphate deacetylase [Yoonia litorea]|uniref:N-acetylglucosamine 6-phosphate deacetylase n=1 Tax=Yoonia litorea TaxID=1123755 RepID=A0A1I6MM56_9RHOB|nr:N-acetylglucosamine-6-phosphate deacetylase [Yoonia litorea]SFS16785.1 N-acetylglucosamine 6-phosphate deacetylase [Yoonia litorea]